MGFIPAAVSLQCSVSRLTLAVQDIRMQEATVSRQRKPRKPLRVLGSLTLVSIKSRFTTSQSGSLSPAVCEKMAYCLFE